LILVDANLLLYAEDSRSPAHEQARDWWDEQLSAADPVCLCWTVVLAFVRISTNRQAFERPLSMKEAVRRVQSWLDQPNVRVVRPTERHWLLLKSLLVDGQASGNLVTDAHLAALAIEHGCALCSTDSDFSRFPKLKWVNPLMGRVE
jgi:toxin-antitoxin system PIN domain toxin